MKPFFYKISFEALRGLVNSRKLVGATSAGVRAVNEMILGIKIPGTGADSAADALTLRADSNARASLPSAMERGNINFSCNFVPFVVKKVLGFN